MAGAAGAGAGAGEGLDLLVADGVGVLVVLAGEVLELPLHPELDVHVPPQTDGGLAVAGDRQHLLPHVTGTSLAEVDLHLDGALQLLDIVEDQWEGDETAGDGDCAEDDGRECDWSQRLLVLLHS